MSDIRSENQPDVDHPASQAVGKLSRHFESMFQTFKLQHRSDWEKLAKFIPFLDMRSARRLRAATGSRVGWVIVEDQYIDRDYRDTFSHIFSRRFATPSARCQRLHFFGIELAEAPDLNSLHERALQDAYLGYAVIRPTRPNGLGRMLVSPRMVLADPEGIEASLCVEQVSLFGSQLQIRGFPFIRQDVDVTTCAQATLWMLRRYYSNRYHQYAETRPYELSVLASRHLHGDRSFPATGLSDWQMAEMLRGLGFSPMIYVKKKFEKFESLLHCYLDSGVPLVLSFDRESGQGGESFAGHAVACFGFRHRMILKHENGLGDYRMKSVLVNDDNYPPYLEVGDYPPPEEYEGAPRFENISSMIVPLPERISLLAEQFDILVRNLVEKGAWSLATQSPILDKVAKDGKLALRIYLTTCKNLKQALSEQKMPDSFVENCYRLMPLPHFVWVCELHDTRLDWPKRCLGEILWDATCNQYERQGLLALHFPEMIAINAAPVFENVVLPEPGWTKIPLQPTDSFTYSPSSANLSKV
jgi:hypothetical protein